MQHEELLDRVRSATEVTARDEATALVEATLTTLGERIGADEAEQIAAQLPAGFNEQVPQGPPERFGVDEFYERVRERSGLGDRIGEDEIAAVFGVLSRAVSRGELEDVRGRLPEGYDHLFPD